MKIEHQIRAIKTPETDTSTFRHLYYNFRYWLEDNNPFTAYISVNNAEEYMNLPRKDRTFMYFWYNQAIIIGGKRILGNKADRDAIETFLEYNFPIQYWVRENGFNLKVKLSVLYDKLRYFINPRQKWLTKQIPNEWNDKVSLIRDINFAMIVHFVEGEKCYEHTDYENSGGGHPKFAKELMECYLYIKTRRPMLDKMYWESFPDDENYTGDYLVDYAETNRLEKEIEDNDTKWLTWIVTNRGYLWT